MLSIIILIFECIYYINNTHKLININIDARNEAPFNTIFNQATILNKLLYILDFITLFICIVLIGCFI